MLGAVAGRAFPSLREAMTAMSRLGPSTQATAPGMARFHSAKRQVHTLMRQLDRQSRGAMRTLDAGDLASNQM
jgi:D-ribulokinase